MVINITAGFGTRDELREPFTLGDNGQYERVRAVVCQQVPVQPECLAPNLTSVAWVNASELRVVPGRVKSTRKNRMTSFNVRIGVNKPAFDLNAFSYKNPMFMLLMSVTVLYTGGICTCTAARSSRSRMQVTWTKGSSSFRSRPCTTRFSA